MNTTTMRAKIGTSGPGLMLRLEGIGVLVGSIGAYVYFGGSGWLFLLLLFVPDAGMIGYLRNVRMGAALYNLVHSYLLPGTLLAASLLADYHTGVLVALIWLAHIGMDRALGYGLKYGTDFKDTHLNRV